MYKAHIIARLAAAVSRSCIRGRTTQKGRSRLNAESDITVVGCSRRNALNVLQYWPVACSQQYSTTKVYGVT